MREILFRGLRKDGQGWVEGTFIQPYSGECYILPSASHIDLSDIDLGGSFIEVNPSTVGQFTGLHDKNGRQIFEGDIWQAPYGSKYIISYVTKLALFTIGYPDGKFASYPFTMPNEGEVIGNIHEGGAE